MTPHYRKVFDDWQSAKDYQRDKLIQILNTDFAIRECTIEIEDHWDANGRSNIYIVTVRGFTEIKE